MIFDWLGVLLEALFEAALELVAFMVKVFAGIFMMVGLLFVLAEDGATRLEDEASGPVESSPSIDHGMNSDQMMINWTKKKFQEFLVELRTGPDQKHLLEAQQQLGEQFDSAVSDQCDPEESPRLRGIADKLLPFFKERHSARVPDIDGWKFFEVSSCDTNAHVTPAAEVYFDREFLASLESDSEVAGVLAHEIAHIHLLHMGSMAHAPFGSAFVSELYEMEADWLAVQILGRAGYAPEALGLALTRLPDSQDDAPDDSDDFMAMLGWMFKSHPPTEERQDAIRAAVKEHYAGR